MEFKKAFDKIIISEGGYVNDPHDNGGETFMGIARKFNPNNKLWYYVDEEKKKKSCGNKALTERLKANPEAVKCVYHTYYRLYWLPLRLDEITNDKLQYQMFDDAVNRGIVAAIRAVQHVVGMTVTGRMSDELIYNINNYHAKK